MAQQEICQIVEQARETFSSRYWWWEVHQLRPQGSIIIAKSNEFAHPRDEGCLATLLDYFSFGNNDDKVYESRRRAANSQVVAPLLAKGWEAAAVNSDGHITMLRRNIEQDPSTSSSSQTEYSPTPISLGQPKKSNTGLIIIAAVVLLCGCCIALSLAWQYGDLIIQNLGF